MEEGDVCRRQVSSAYATRTAGLLTSPPWGIRFAAKEAAIKAHSHRRLTFHDIVIERRGRDEERLGSGPPVARIRGEPGEAEDASAMVSISHDGDYATAVCMGHDPNVVKQGGAET